MSKVFISDLHIAEFHTRRQMTTLKRVLKAAIQEESEVYILGDLMEIWIGDDDDSALASEMKTVLRDCSKHTPLYFMHGNRDFLLGETFANEVNMTILEDPTVIEINGIRTLLSHGDKYCTSDIEYMEMRKMFREESWQKKFLAQDLQTRRNFANIVRQQSTAATQTKDYEITDVVVSTLVEDMTDHDCELMIHGHTHRPGQHLMTHGNLRRIVLGAWHYTAWQIRTQPELVLECLPLEEA